MKNLLLKIHLYSGLFFFPLLVIFGLSSLHINHHFQLFEENQEWSEEQVLNLHFKDTSDNQVLAETIRDSLGLMGWCPWWKQNREGDKYRFGVVHNGAEYKINADLSKDLVTLKKRGKGFANVLQSLHFLGEEIPRGPLAVNSWRFYQTLGVVYLLLASATGIFLFSRKKKERKTGLIIGCGFFTASVLLMLYIWQVG